jgi:hypothetical protein
MSVSIQFALIHEPRKREFTVQSLHKTVDTEALERDIL